MRVNTADGIYLWDAKGKRYIDGQGGMWCMQIGFGRQEMADAIAAQVMQMPYASPWSFTSEPPAVLAQMIAERAPGDLNAVYFTTGGSTAVDTALWTAMFMNKRLGRPNKKIIIAREKGYHGSTFLAATVTGKERFETQFEKVDDLVRFLPDVNPYHRPNGMSMDAWCDASVADLENLIAQVGADRIAAFIAEPILCSGGVIVPPPGYHKRTRYICRTHDILYISDEVVTGFGRLGHWFASEAVYDIVPDMITCAKGLTSGYLPLGACIISHAVMARIADAEGDDLFYNGYTYSGHPVACAAAIKNKFDIVGDVRGKGLSGCIECRPELTKETYDAHLKFGQKLDDACEEMGLLLRPFGNMAVFSPPLIINESQIDEMFDIIEAGLEKLSAEYNG